MTSLEEISLPSHWSWQPLKHVTQVLRRGTAPHYVDDGPIRVIGQAANQRDGFLWDRTRFHSYSGDPRQLKGFLEVGDILINSTGTGTVGRIGFFEGGPDERPCIADSHITIARATDAIEPRFLFYYLNSTPFQDLLAATCIVGATNQIELNVERLGVTPVPIPPHDEQQRIASFLDDATNQIAQITSARAKQIDLLTERTLALITESLIPGSLSSPGGKWPWKWLPETTERTPPIVRLGYVCRLQSGLTVDGSRILGRDVVTRPYLRVANVQEGRLDLESITEITVPRRIAERSTLQVGDVLMTEGGDLDKLGRGTVWRGEIPDCLHQNHIFAVRPNPDRLDADYLALMTRTLHGRCYFESTGVKTTNLASTSSSKILSFPIPLPDVHEQRRIVKRVQEELAIIDSAKEAIERQNQLLNERKLAIITRAVTGQIDLTAARCDSS